MFQGFGDPAKMIVGQTGDKKTLENIKKDLYLDQPKWKQFILYLNDVSPLSIHTKEDIARKQLQGFLLAATQKLQLKFLTSVKAIKPKKLLGRY